MKLRLAQPKHLVDIGRVKGLSGIREEGGHFVIGALTTHYAVESSAAVKQKCAMLAEAAAMIGDPQVRNYGTIGGSVAHADPAADWPAVLLALGAELKAVGPKGARTIKVDDFFKDLFTTALGPDEVLTEIHIPTGGHGGAAYVKHPHPASRFAVCGVAAAVALDGTGKCKAAHVGVTGVGSKAVRAKGVEAALDREDARRGHDRRGRPEGGRRHRHQRRPPGLGRVQGASHARLHAAGARARRRAGQGRQVGAGEPARAGPGCACQRGRTRALVFSVAAR